MMARFGALPVNAATGGGPAHVRRRAMTALLIGYARCSNDQQDLTVQREGLLGLGVDIARIYVDHGLPAPTGNVRDSAKRWQLAAMATRWS